MPLRKLNRLISLNVLKEFNIKQNYAFNELYNLNNKNNKININDLGYIIGPILNAGGRLGKSSYATELLSSDNLKIISERSIELHELNEKRKNLIYYKRFVNGHFGIILASFRDHLVVILVSFWDHFGIILGSFWDHFGVIFVLFWDYLGIVLG